MASSSLIQTLLFPSLPHNHRHQFIPFSLSTAVASTLHRRLSLSLSLSTSLSAAAAAAYPYNNNDDDDDERRPSSSPQDAGRLYVGNLPFSTTSSQLAPLFAQAGTVQSAEVVCDRFTERSRGFAFVTMATIEEANEAIRMFDGSQIGGRVVKVNFPEVPKGRERELLGPRSRGASLGYADSPFKVYAGNLGWSLTSQGLHDAFVSLPGCLGAKVIYHRDTGRSRGFGFVSFASYEECQAAIDAMNGVEIEGRPLRLTHAEGKPVTSSSMDSTVAQDPNSNSFETSPSY